MKLYFHISNQSNDRFYDLKGQIHQEYEITNYEGNKVKSYRKIEDFRCFIAKGKNYESVKFEIDFGKDSCSGHWADNAKDFKADFEKKQFGDWELVTREDYEAIRKEAFEAYQSNMFLNLDSVKKIQDFSVRSLTK